MSLKTVLTAAAVVAGVGLSPVLARAQSLPVTHREGVRFSDLDLTREAGARGALARIAAAAERVCGPEELPAYTTAWDDRRECLAESTSRAVAKLRRPIVTAMYGGRFSTPAIEMADNSARSAER